MTRVGSVSATLLLLATFANLWLVNRGNNLSTEAPPSTAAVGKFLRPVLNDRDIFRVRLSDGSLNHNSGNLLGLQIVSGDSPFELQPFKDWTEDGPAGGRVQEWPLLRLTNTHYVVSSKDLCDGPCQPASGFELLSTLNLPPGSPLLETTQATELRLYRVLYPLPRAFFVTGASPAGSDRAAIDAINQPGFDGQQTVLLPPAAITHSTSQAPQANLRADVTGYAPGFVDMRTTSSQPAYLLLSEVAYPDWQATVDGRPARILPADGLLMALDLPPGQHHVVFRIVPRLLFAGGAISVATLMLLGALAAWSLRRPVSEGKREPSPPEDIAELRRTEGEGTTMAAR